MTRFGVSARMTHFPHRLLRPPRRLTQVGVPATLALILLPVCAPVDAAAQTLEEIVWAAVTLERTLERREVAGILALGALHRLAGAEGRVGATGSSGAGSPWGTPSGTPAGTPGGTPGRGVGWPPDPERLEAASLWLADAVARVQTGAAGPTCAPAGDAVDGVRCALQSLLPGAPAEVAQALAAEGRAFLALQVRDPLRSQVRMSVADPLQQYTETVLDQVAGLRAQLEGLQSDDGVFDARRVLQRLTGIDPSASVPSLLATSTGLQGLADGVLGEGRDVMEAYAAYLNSLTGSARGWLGEAQALEGRVQGLRSLASDRAMVYLTGKTAAVTGLEAAVTDRIRVLGNAALDLQAEGGVFLQNLRQMGQQAAVGLLSGNMLSVAQGVATFLQLSPGAFGAETAADIREIREMVTRLEGELRSGFEGVDARFDEVFRELDSGFARMETLVQRQHEEVMVELGEIQVGLASLATRTDRFESSVRAYLEAGFDRDHARTLIRCLEHRDRFTQPMAEPVFRECLTDFRARGARDARDALLTDRTTPVDDASLMRALEDRSLENLARSLPLLARAAEQRFGYPGLGGGRGGANPVEWAVAAQAYVTMLEEWPDLAAQVGPADLEALVGVGIELRSVLGAMVVDPASGEVGAFTARILDAYGRGLEEAAAEADLLARRYQQAQLRRVDPAELLNQAVPAAGAGAAIPLPEHVRGGIPNEVRTATVLALESPGLVYRMTVADSVDLDNLRRRWNFFGRDHDRRTYTRTTLTLELRQSDGTLISLWAVTGPPVHRMTEVMAGRFDSDRVRSRVVHIPDPQDHFLREHYPVLARSDQGWTSGIRSSRVVTALGEAIEDELRRFESASLNRIFGAVCDVGPPAGALGAEDQASVLRLRRAIDQMTAARQVLMAAVGLALPPERLMSGTLPRLLDGEDGLLDRGRLCGIVASGDSPLRVVWLEEVPQRRLQELAESLEAEWAGLVWKDPSGVRTPVPSTRVDETLELLRGAIRLQELRRLTVAAP